MKRQSGKKSAGARKQGRSGSKSRGITSLPAWKSLLYLGSMMSVLIVAIIVLDAWAARHGYPSLLFSSRTSRNIASQTHSPRGSLKKHSAENGQRPASNNSQASMTQHAASHRSKPVTPAKWKAAIIIDDMGRDMKVANQLLQLNAPLTFSVIPFQPYSREVCELVHSRRHVVMAHIPMESIHPDKMTPSLPWLLVGLKPSQIIETLDSEFRNLRFVQGANNHTGSRFTTHRREMKIVLTYLKKHGLFFVDSRTTADTVGLSIARELGIPSEQRRVFFDDKDDLDSIRKECERFISMVTEGKATIAIGHPKRNTILALKEYIPKFRAQGISIVPVTDVLSPKLTPDFVARRKDKI